MFKSFLINISVFCQIFFFNQSFQLEYMIIIANTQQIILYINNLQLNHHSNIIQLENLYQKQKMQQETNNKNEQIEEHILRRYQIQVKLGSGAYGHVWKVLDKKTNNVYALKKIFDAFQNATDAQRTYRQITVLKQLSNIHIIKLFKVIRAENDKDIYLIFDYMDSDLHSVIRDDILLDKHKKYITYQLAKVLKYIHSAELIHRDLKPSNILINQQCFIKVCDFGLVRTLSTKYNDQQILTEYVATRWYRSPQILLGSQNYDKSTDMWSLGCIIGEILLGKPMFPGKSTIDQLEKILSFTGNPTLEERKSIKCPEIDIIFKEIKIKQRPIKQWFREIDPLAIDLISKLLRFNPQQRLTAKQVLRHPYVSEFRVECQQVSCIFPIQCDVNDNKKLSVKEYRNIIYDTLTKDNYLKVKNCNHMDQTKNHNFRSKKKENHSKSLEKGLQTKSQWISPYLKESKLVVLSNEKKVSKGKQHQIKSYYKNAGTTEIVLKKIGSGKLKRYHKIPNKIVKE